MFSDEIKTFRCDHNSWRRERCVEGEERKGGRGGECVWEREGRVENVGGSE